MSIILSNRVRNHIDSIVKEHLYLDDCKSDDTKLYSRALTAICLAGLAGTHYSHVKDSSLMEPVITELMGFSMTAYGTSYT